jgi:DNA adenine methylase
VKQTSYRYVTPRPFLKWVGGKGQLLDELLKRVGQAEPFERYHEPFIGGGALFFELARQQRLGRKRAFLSDNNPNLIDAYLGVRDHLDELIQRLKAHKSKHSETYYYEVRAQVPRELPARAARIIYLNKTGYNGLYRENSKGNFNVPFGRYKNPTICDEVNLRAASQVLQRARIEVRHFESVLKVSKPGDLVYFDPPYWPLSLTSSFTSYAQAGFGEDSQRLLAKVFEELTGKGVKALLSNSMTPFIQELYEPFKIQTVLAARAVNSRANGRGKIEEALVRNF